MGIEMTGFAYLYSETGTKGGWWAMQQDGFLDCDYQGLQLLEEGDDFTVFADDGKRLRQGIVHQDTTTGFMSRQVIHEGTLVNDRDWKQQVVGGMWVHWVQAGIDPEEWGGLFIGEKRCLLTRTSILEIVSNMVDLIGRKLTSYVGGAKDVRAVDRWMSGGNSARVPSTG